MEYVRAKFKPIFLIIEHADFYWLFLHFSYRRSKKSDKVFELNRNYISQSNSCIEFEFKQTFFAKSVPNRLNFLNLKLHKVFDCLFFIISASGDVLQRHIPKVKRVIVKVIRNIDDLDSIADYLQVMGKLHYQQGIQVRQKKAFNTISKMFVLCCIFV